MKERLRTLFYYANLAWMRFFLFFASSRDIQGRDNVPRKGPLILVCNHLNNVDTPVLGDATPRQIAWLTKAEWFSTPVIGLMLRIGGMIPVRRFEADLGALRQAEKHLKGGGCLGMFPEGTRSHGKGLGRGEPGSALIALRSGSPIQPMAIWGTEHAKIPRDFFRRTKVHVRFGVPFRLTASGKIKRKDVEDGTRRIMEEIAALLPPELRGVYGNALGKTEGVGTNP